MSTVRYAAVLDLKQIPIQTRCVVDSWPARGVLRRSPVQLQRPAFYTPVKLLAHTPPLPPPAARRDDGRKVVSPNGPDRGLAFASGLGHGIEPSGAARASRVSIKMRPPPRRSLVSGCCLRRLRCIAAKPTPPLPRFLGCPWAVRHMTAALQQLLRARAAFRFCFVALLVFFVYDRERESVSEAALER